MNQERRRRLRLVLKEIEELAMQVERAKEHLQQVVDAEQEALLNLPESIQDSDRGELMQENIEALEGIIDSLGEVDTDEMRRIIEEVAEG